MPGDIREQIIGPNQIELIEMLLRNEIDAAFVRTGVLERLFTDGRLDEQDVRIIEPVLDRRHNFVRTTRVYPEWMVVARGNLQPEEIAVLSRTLYVLPSDSAAAHAAGIEGFIPPLDVAPVIEAMQAAKIPPYYSSAQ